MFWSLKLKVKTNPSILESGCSDEKNNKKKHNTPGSSYFTCPPPDRDKMNRIFSLTSKTCISNLITFRETAGNYSQLKIISESFN